MSELATNIYNQLQKMADSDMAELPVGIRAHYKDEVVSAGVELAESFVWVDNIKTSERLCGTSCIGLAPSAEHLFNYTDDDKILAKIEDMLKNLKHYGNSDKISLICGDSYTNGADDFNNEYVISNAKVVDVFNWA